MLSMRCHAGLRSLALRSFGLSPIRTLRVAAGGPLGIVVSAVGDVVHVHGLHCAPWSLLAFSGGAAGLVTEMRSDGSAVALVVSGPPPFARETAAVEALSATFPASVDLCSGRIVDALGAPLDGRGRLTADGGDFGGHRFESVPMLSLASPSVTSRAPPRRALVTGFKAIDAFATVRQGDSLALVGEAGSGKRQLALDILGAMAASASGLGAQSGPLFVWTSVGRSSSGVAAAVADLRANGALTRTAVVAAPATAHAGALYLAPFAGAALAHLLARRGRDVVLVHDSLSAHAMMAGARLGATSNNGHAAAAALLDSAAQLNTRGGGGSVTVVALLDSVPSAAAAAAAELGAAWVGRGAAGGGGSTPPGLGGSGSSGLPPPTRESVRQQALVMHAVSLASSVFTLDRDGMPHAVTSSATRGLARGAPLATTLDALSLRAAGHAAQGAALRHYTARAVTVLQQLRTTAWSARAASELGLEHETDADALLDLYHKAALLLLPPGGSSGSSGGSGSRAGPPAGCEAAQQQPEAADVDSARLSAPAAAAAPAQAAAAAADARRNAALAFLAARRGSAAPPLAAAAAAAADAARSHAGETLPRVLQPATTLASRDGRGDVNAAVTPPPARRVAGLAPPGPRPAPAQAFTAATATAEVCDIDDPSAASSLSVTSLRRLRRFGASLDADIACAAAFDAVLRHCGSTAAAVAPAAAPHHGSPARTLLALFLLSHGYVQRVPAARLWRYERELYALLCAAPVPPLENAAEGADDGDQLGFENSGAPPESLLHAALMQPLVPAETLLRSLDSLDVATELRASTLLLAAASSRGAFAVATKPTPPPPVPAPPTPARPAAGTLAWFFARTAVPPRAVPPPPPVRAPTPPDPNDALAVLGLRGHLRLGEGVALEDLPPVWAALHVLTADFTRRFCGEPGY